MLTIAGNDSASLPALGIIQKLLASFLRFQSDDFSFDRVERGRFVTGQRTLLAVSLVDDGACFRRFCCAALADFLKGHNGFLRVLGNVPGSHNYGCGM